MNISANNQVKNHQSLLDLLFNQSKNKHTISAKQNKSMGIDMVTISQEARELSSVKKSAGRSLNTKADRTIDLKSYIEEAKKSNQEALDNAGTAIDVNAVAYTGEDTALRAALMEKYTKFVEEAKTHSNPENHILQKYYNQKYEYYENDLSDTERRIAYNYEKNIYESGKLMGLHFQDSLLRGMEVNGNVADTIKIAFQRQLVNNQISNILTSAGIDKTNISDQCSFSVDPYSYQITVSGVDDETKAAMEQALNVGDNGENLFMHIYATSIQDGCNSTQVNRGSKSKYEAYQYVYEYTGLKLDELKAKNGTYYTSDGVDILGIVNKNIGKSEKVPGAYKGPLKSWIQSLVSEISLRGWNNISDMKLNILYSANGLEDTNQSISFARDSEWCNSTIGDAWYAVF
ncbi:DUF4885 domain-containing protein [Lachnospiraceae bacterium ZAX-1]